MRITIREATRDDTLRLAAFLKKHTETCMFMRGNLRDFGIGRSKEPYAMRYFLREKSGAIQGVGAVSNGNTLMMQAHEGLEDIAKHIQEVLPSDVKYTSILGEAHQVEVFKDVLGLTHLKTVMDEVEPLFALDLKKLKIPSFDNMALTSPKKEHIKTLEDWSYDYGQEALKKRPSSALRAEIVQEVASNINKDRTRVLLKKDGSGTDLNGEMISKTNFNAVLPDCVQVGGVYTPPSLRGKGFARLVVALHLQEAHQKGVERAILFSANDYASRAYQAIGFKQVGEYTLTVFDHESS